MGINVLGINPVIKQARLDRVEFAVVFIDLFDPEITASFHWKPNDNASPRQWAIDYVDSLDVLVVRESVRLVVAPTDTWGGYDMLTHIATRTANLIEVSDDDLYKVVGDAADPTEANCHKFVRRMFDWDKTHYNNDICKATARAVFGITALNDDALFATMHEIKPEEADNAENNPSPADTGSN